MGLSNQDLLDHIKATEDRLKSGLHAEIKKQNRELHHSIGALGRIVVEVQGEVKKLANWKTGMMAVEAYKKDHPEKANWMTKELLAALFKALSIIAALIGLMTLYLRGKL